MQLHLAMQKTSNTVHAGKELPDESKYVQLPLPEQTVPGSFVGHASEGAMQVLLVDEQRPYKQLLSFVQAEPTPPTALMDDTATHAVFESPTMPV